MAKRDRRVMRRARHRRVRRRVFGTRERPRLAVFRSLMHVYAQLVDDVAGETLAAASTLSKEFKAAGKRGRDVDGARLVGEFIAGKALKLGIGTITFDRGGYRFHGRVKALAEGARARGLKF